MRKQEAVTVVSAPLAVVERALEDVTSWPEYLVGVESVEPLGHQRYRFCLADGRDRRQSVVCVRHLFAEHRFTWRALEGPTFTGRWELRAVDERHTEVRLCLETHPGTLFAGLAEMIIPRLGRAAHDLRKLEEHLVAAR